MLVRFHFRYLLARIILSASTLAMCPYKFYPKNTRKELGPYSISLPSYCFASAFSIKHPITPCQQHPPHFHSMDSPIVAQLFRQLFRHRPRGCKGNLPNLRNGLREPLVSAPVSYSGTHQARAYVARPSRDRGMKKNESRWQQRTNILPQDRSSEFEEYPYISLDELKNRTERPRKVKMSMRDFIDGKSCSVRFSYTSINVANSQIVYTTPHTATFPSRP